MALLSEIGAHGGRERLERAYGRGFQHGLALRMSGGVPLTRTQSRLGAACKRLLDLILASMALLALSPVLVALSVAIRLSSPGPVLFRQMRHGKGGVPFAIYKFRSMHATSSDSAGVLQARPDDARVTRLGRIMRATSLDELPQLINIVRGEMSLIGPRPHPIGMLAGGVPYEALVPYYHERHTVKPGLSGWAQVNGLRGPTVDPVLARDRIDHDIAYIQNQSLLLDLKIIFLTVKREFLTGTGE